MADDVQSELMRAAERYASSVHFMQRFRLLHEL